MKRFALPAVVAAFLTGGLFLTADAPKPKSDADLEQLLKKATVNGKYRMLVAQIHIGDNAEEKKSGVDFQDMGAQNAGGFHGQSGVPKGYWVFAKPYLYVWRDLSATAAARQKRAWGVEQACGEPDTQGAGDIQTAWASQSQDDQDEWLMLEYSEPVVPIAVLVHETYNPGSLVRVTALKLDGTEVELWKGQDPTPGDSESGVSEVPVKVDFKTNRIKIYLASKDVPGWNEIDAVGVRAKDGKMHWATSAEASSNYAPPFEDTPRIIPPPQRLVPAQAEMRIKKLEDEVAALKAMVEELKKKVEKKDK